MINFTNKRLSNPKFLKHTIYSPIKLPNTKKIDNIHGYQCIFHKFGFWSFIHEEYQIQTLPQEKNTQDVA